MCPERTLKGEINRKNTTGSVMPAEIVAQQKELAASERKLEQAGNAVTRIKEKVALERQRLADARSQHRAQNTKQSQRAFNSATNRLQKLRQDRDNLMSEYRELKLIVRDQRNLLASLEKKEVAKQEAVARFLKEWERNYDREMRMKRMTVHKRKRLIKI